jgi:RteC protein
MDKIKAAFNTCFENLEYKIQHIISKKLSPFEQSTQILPHVFDAQKKVDKAILSSKFINTEAEINFFKTLKPKLVALEKCHRKIIEIESNNKSLTADQLANYLTEISNIKPSKKDQEVYKYYKLRCSHQDSNYFLLKQNINHIPFINSKENFNPNTTTYHSEKFAQFIANEMIAATIKERQQPIPTVQPEQTITLNWSQSQVCLVELVQAISYNLKKDNTHKNIDAFQKLLCKIFNLEYSNFNSKWNNISKRKKDKLVYLPQLVQEFEEAIKSGITILIYAITICTNFLSEISFNELQFVAEIL